MYNAGCLTPQVNTKGLLAHWKMWDGFASSGKVFDYALNANLGTTTMLSYGAFPGYKFVNGSQINCASDATLDNLFDGGGSFSGWIRPTGVGQATYGRLFDKSHNTTIGQLIFCNNSVTELRLLLITDTTNGTWSFPVDMTGDIWQHLVLTYDADTSAAGGGPTVYVNGEEVVVTEVAAPDDVRTSDAVGDMYIGQNSAGGKSWNGKTDDIMFFDRILGAPEVKSIYSVTRQRYGV